MSARGTDRVIKSDFTWSETDEPHATRRRLILAKHPEVANLFGKEPRTFWVSLAIVISQIVSAYYVRNWSWGWFLLWGYVYGATVNHTLQMAVHELSHNLCWESEKLNKLTGMLANTATGIPSCISFQKYHMEHHQFQGVEGVDTDLPTPIEGKLFTTSLLKVIYISLQPLLYTLRPFYLKPKKPGFWEILSITIQFSFNALIVYYLGWTALGYLIMCTFMGFGLHPASGHLIAEHYEFSAGQETYSYYGPCNYVNFNVGYHNEHHDFPRVPWSNLPKVRALAPEFYETLPHHTSYVSVMLRYILDPHVTPWARVKRLQKYANANPQKAN